MQRMGEPDEMYTSFVSDEAMINVKEELDIERILVRRSATQLEEAVSDIKNKHKENDAILTQWYELAITAYKWRKGEDLNSVLCDLDRIMRVTRQAEFNTFSSYGIGYTRCELITAQLKAICMMRIGKIDEAGTILNRLIEIYCGIYSDRELFFEAKVSVLYDLAEFNMRAGQPDSSEFLCEQALKTCAKYGIVSYVLPLVTQRARIMSELGKAEESLKAAKSARLLERITADIDYLPRFEDYPGV